MDQSYEAEHRPDSSSSARPHELHMHKLLRRKRTKAFLAPDGSWTRDIRKALHLPGAVDAEAAIERFKPEELEVYYSFDYYGESRWDFALPLK